MMFSLLRRDPLLGQQTSIWMMWGGIAALNAGVLSGLVATLAAGSSAWALGPVAGKAFLALILWLSTSLFLISGKTGQRCRPFDMALPIPARRLWMAHNLALVLVGLAFLALSAGVLEALFRTLGNTRIDFSVMKQALAGLILPIASTFILAVVLLQSAAPSLYRTPEGRRRRLISFAVVCLSLGCAFALSFLPPPAALLPLGLAFWLCFRTFRALPPAFALMPREAESSGLPAGVEQQTNEGSAELAREWDREARSAAPGGWWIGWHLFRLLYLDPGRIILGFLIMFPLNLAWGFFMSGFLAAWRYADLPQFSNVILTGYLLISFLPAQIKRLPLIDAWPVSRRSLFALLMAPPFLALALGLGAGRTGALLLERSRPQILYQEGESPFFPPYPSKTPMIRVPAQYCRIAWDGRTPELTSPWGESHPAWSYPLVRGSRIAVVAPFSTSEAGSPRFVALQISRAIEAVYGRSVPYEEVLKRYLEPSRDGSVRLKGGQLGLLSDYPDLEPQGEIALFPVLILMVVTVWLILTGVYLRACRAHITDAGRMWVFVILAVSVIAANITQVAVMIAGLVRPDAGAAFLKIFIRNCTAMPEGELLLWILCLLWLVVGYRLVQTRFLQIEVLPGRPDRE